MLNNKQEVVCKRKDKNWAMKNLISLRGVIRKEMIKQTKKKDKSNEGKGEQEMGKIS